MIYYITNSDCFFKLTGKDKDFAEKMDSLITYLSLLNIKYSVNEGKNHINSNFKTDFYFQVILNENILRIGFVIHKNGYLSQMIINKNDNFTSNYYIGGYNDGLHLMYKLINRYLAEENIDKSTI